MQPNADQSIAFVTGMLARSVGGTSSAIVGLARALGAQGWQVVLHHVSPPDANDRIDELEPAQGRAHRAWLAGQLALSGAMKRSLREAAAGTLLYHAHGLWTMPGHYAALAARRGGRRLVWSMHNMLKPEYLAHHAVRKRAFLAAFGRRDLRSAACLHALTEAELADIRRFGLTNPVAVVPNGTSLPQPPSSGQLELLEERFCWLRSRRWILFLGRLHRQKGLACLIQAWARLARGFADWHLVLAGPDWGGYRGRLERLAQDQGVADRLTFVGPLDEAGRNAALHRAELLVLPSRGEGFSSAVLEALAAARPVLISPGCCFPEAVQCGAALQAEPEPGPWACRLEQLLSLPDAERRRMGRCGQELVRRSYTWQRIASRMIAVYRWLALDGPMPDEVHRA